MNHKISIIVPCYNQGIFLDDCCDSIYKQSYENWECLIINDGSTDDTEKIALSWIAKDNRFKYYYKENGGLSSARNLGLEMATGCFIKFLDSDDFLYPENLSKTISSLEYADISITSFNHIKNGETQPPFCQLKEEFLNYEAILLQWDDTFSIPIHCGIFKKDLFNNIRFIESIKSGEDWIMWISIYKKKPKTVFINEELVCYRLHDHSITTDPNNMIYKKLSAQLYIFDNLTTNLEQKLFFERFSLEALQRRYAHMFIKNKKKKNMFQKIKNIFNKK